MRPPPRTTRNTKSPPSPDAADRPRPTMADIQLAPRRRLRDGSSSSRGRSSRGSSVASSTSSRASSARRRVASVVTASASASASAAATPPTSTVIRGRETTDRSRPVSVSSTSSSSSHRHRWREPTPYPDPEEEMNPASPFSSGSTLSPPPPEESISVRRATSPRPNVNQTLSQALSIDDVLEDLEGLEHLPPPSTPPSEHIHRPRRGNLSTPYHHRVGRLQSPANTSTSSSASSSSGPIALDTVAGRRYTAQEKGKGRAVVTPIEIDESSGEGDDSVQIVNITQKRKRGMSDDIVKGLVENASVDEPSMDEDSLLGTGYTCPICFCAPTQAVMTPCGHILCAQCLHSSLIAAIGRNPNPHPNQQPMHWRGRGGFRGRGGRYSRARGGAAAAAAASVNRNGRPDPYGPTEWTRELLQEAWVKFQINLTEKQLQRAAVPKENWEVTKEAVVPDAQDVKVDEVLKGLWKIDGHAWVVEGECPVCRNILPGGYGPPYSGIGGITPLKARLSSVVTAGNKRRK
ncbi:hypothetical protein CI109_101302 [Kwoniella shandongensis]|uniref:Uncharacterized protein n=1 Tax=Kwoniella shandongensis TaxID=1734106 RepID=A0A5M6BUF3_9TREE|nr:uncharacterized protein CI109_005320 [Kwoniella shandongensis]KAA5526363.1 hypothetical protein CI109_005320 [Kwoniella shandongensis]